MNALAQAPLKSSIVIHGQLALRTIHGRNGPFNVARLTTSIGVFEIKDAELEQYPEGKYEGEFTIRYIFAKAYPTGGGMRFEIRANLDGMTLFGVDKLNKEDAGLFSPQEIDPLDEEQPQSSTSKAVPAIKSKDPLLDNTPFGVDAPETAVDADAALFGLLWPLGESVKLDSTIDRRKLRQQIARIGKLGYEFDTGSQCWNRKA